MLYALFSDLKLSSVSEHRCETWCQWCPPLETFIVKQKNWCDRFFLSATVRRLSYVQSVQIHGGKSQMVLAHRVNTVSCCKTVFTYELFLPSFCLDDVLLHKSTRPLLSFCGYFIQSFTTRERLSREHYTVNILSKTKVTIMSTTCCWWYFSCNKPISIYHFQLTAFVCPVGIV